MLRDFAWNKFEETGNIETYMFYREIEGKAVVQKDEGKVEEEK